MLVIIKNITTTTFLVLILTTTAIFGFARHKAKVTYYADRYNGRKTATGERYSDNGLTCATSDYRYFKKKIRFFNGNGASVVVKCNDIMKNDGTLRFDLTKKAFRMMHNNSLQCGVSMLEFSVTDSYVVDDSTPHITKDSVTDNFCTKDSDMTICD